MKRVFFCALLISLCVVLCGCGETITGVGKDAERMGKGINTFFFRQP